MLIKVSTIAVGGDQARAHRSLRPSSHSGQPAATADSSLNIASYRSVSEDDHFGRKSATGIGGGVVSRCVVLESSSFHARNCRCISGNLTIPICCVCDKRITKDTGWHVHHIARRVDGGANASRNLIMVHPNCHARIRSLVLSVTKPAPH